MCMSISQESGVNRELCCLGKEPQCPFGMMPPGLHLQLGSGDAAKPLRMLETSYLKSFLLHLNVSGWLLLSFTSEVQPCARLKSHGPPSTLLFLFVPCLLTHKSSYSTNTTSSDFLQDLVIYVLGQAKLLRVLLLPTSLQNSVESHLLCEVQMSQWTTSNPDELFVQLSPCQHTHSHTNQNFYFNILILISEKQ